MQSWPGSSNWLRIMRRPEIVGDVVPGHGWVRATVETVGRFLIRLLVRVEATGLANVPAEGSLVVIINHIAFWDPILVMGAIKSRLIIPMSKVEVLGFPVVGWLVKAGGTIPVHRGEADTRAIKLALSVLKHDGAVLLAPEGTRSRTYQMQPAKDGATMLALRSQAVVVPVAVIGAHRLLDGWRRLKRPLVTVTIGSPFTLQTPSGQRKPSRDETSLLTQQMMYRLAELVPPDYRGVYRHVEPVDPRVIRPLTNF